MPGAKRKNYKFILWWLALLPILAVLLGACGQNPTQSAQTQVTATSGVLTASRLPPTEIPVGNPLVRASTAAATSTPVIAATPTADSLGTSLLSPTRTVPTPSPAPKPTATPTPRGAAEKIDRENELKLAKTAYDAINKHLFREPDNTALLEVALKELATLTGAPAPALTFNGDPEATWNTFSEGFNRVLDGAKNFTYPKNQLGQRVVNVMAEKVGDEHTYFLDSSSYQSRQNLLSGNNVSVGFGVLVTTQQDKAFIVRVVAGSPADKAGIKPGDQIIQYNNQPVTDKNWTIIRNSKENETYQFVLGRIGQTRPITVSVTKQKYNLPTVEYRLVNGHIGHISIRDFFLNVADETDRAMVELRKQGADSWIIDVRENPGGVNVELVVGRFVPEGEIIGYNASRTGRDPMKASNDLTGGSNKGKPFAPALPLVLLMDEISASSSEMLALAVRDFKLGPLIGSRTAGALGHTAAYPLGDGTAISVTVDEYESRGGTKVNGVGVSPDIEVERSIEDLVAGRDPQLKAGVEYLERLLAKK